jgi:predicted N-acetyltransferase YhbS
LTLKEPHVMEIGTGIRTIRWPEEREAILEHIRLVHGPGDSDLLGHWYGTMPGFDPEDCFVIDGENGEIAAHTMLIPRQVQFGESVLQASEVGVVGTLDTYRKQGLASALMNRAVERMTERGDAVSILFGIPNFYERWGYDYGLGLYLTAHRPTAWRDRDRHHRSYLRSGRSSGGNGDVRARISEGHIDHRTRPGYVAVADELHDRHRAQRQWQFSRRGV